MGDRQGADVRGERSNVPRDSAALYYETLP